MDLLSVELTMTLQDSVTTAPPDTLKASLALGSSAMTQASPLLPELAIAEVSISTVSKPSTRAKNRPAALPFADAALMDVFGLFATGDLSTSVTMRVES